MQVATAAQMRELDRRTIEDLGVPGMVLMENAGRGTVDCMRTHLGPMAGRTVAIFVGPGNNGGDGLVIARTILNQGGKPCIFFLLDPGKLRGDAGLNYTIVKKLGLTTHVLEAGTVAHTVEAVLSGHSLAAPVHSLVDSIFGTGLARTVEGIWLETISVINGLRTRCRWPTVAVDIPSGLNSDTGRPLGDAVVADLTVTYGLAKPGHFHHGGPYTGSLRVVDIGIPASVRQQVGLQGSALDASATRLLHTKPVHAHKGTNGHLLVVAGSAGKTGAAILCARGALASGAGLVTLAVPEGLNPIFETSLPEAMTVPLPQSATALDVADYSRILQLAQGKQAMVIGPGIGMEPGTRELVLKLYADAELPLVIDADGLNLLADRQQGLLSPPAPRIFTPHPGEMARLLNTTTARVQEDRAQAALWLQHGDEQTDHPLITILKGAGTLVCDHTGRWAINTSGNPGMATGGMGDVLAGLTGGLVAQGYVPWEAACLGVYLHGAAADLVARNRPYGYTAGDVAARIPVAIAESLNNKE